MMFDTFRRSTLFTPRTILASAIRHFKAQFVTAFLSCALISGIAITASGVIGAREVKKATGKLPTPGWIYTTENQREWATIPHFSHLLVFYGLEETDLPGYSSGQSLVRALMDERKSIEIFGESPFVRTRNGLRYKTIGEPLSSSGVGEAHRDQILAIFAHLGLPRETSIKLKDRTFSILDLVTETVSSFDLEYHEPAWTSIGLATYLPPQRQWVNRFGEETTFSQLTHRLLELDLGFFGLLYGSFLA